jgi:hypothetical protein
MEAGGVTLGAEATQAEALWAAALRQAPRMQTPFDPVWWANVLTAQKASAATSSTSPAHPSALAKRRNMRLRKEVYRRASILRHELNRQDRRERKSIAEALI